MKDHILIATNSAGSTFPMSRKDRDQITGYLEGKGWHVWHWYEDLWLARCRPPEDISALEVKQELQALLGGKDNSLIVTTMDGSYDFASNLPTGSIPWLKAQWMD